MAHHEFETQTVEFKRNLIRPLLQQCTEPQKALFNRMYGSIEAIQEKQMAHAYRQCKRTVEKNNE